MRRTWAAVVLLLGGVVAGIGARVERDAQDVLRFHWTWWRHEPPGFATRLVPNLVPNAAIAAAFDHHRGAIHAVAALVALALGLATAQGLAVWRAARAAAPTRAAWRWGTRAACVLAWWGALDPELLHFVATRTGLAATQFFEVEDLCVALGAGAVLVAVATWIGPRAAASEPAAPPPWRARVSLALAVATGVLLPAFLSRAVLGQQPCVNDEHSYLFQSRLFARGELVYDTHGLEDFFPARQVAESHGRLFSKYPPAHAALLSIGERVHLPELMPRLLAAFAILATFDLARRAGVARPTWAAWGLALSPTWVGLESLWLSHSTSIPCSIVLVWSVCTATVFATEGRRGAACGLMSLGGLAFGVDFAARPVTALAVALPLVLLLLVRRPRGVVALVASGALGAAPPLAALLWTNHALTGSAFQFAYDLYAKSNAPEDRFGNVSLALALENSAFNLSRLSVWACGVAPGVLVAVVACALPSPLRWRGVLVGVPAALLCAYAFHPFQGVSNFGPLYLSEGAPLLAILGAQALSLAASSFGRRFAASAAAVVLAASALLLRLHFGAMHTEARRHVDLFAPVRAAKVESGVVFVHGEDEWSAKHLALLPPEPGDRLVYALDLGRRNRELVDFLHAKSTWLLDLEKGKLRRLR